MGAAVRGGAWAPQPDPPWEDRLHTPHRHGHAAPADLTGRQCLISLQEEGRALINLRRHSVRTGLGRARDGQRAGKTDVVTGAPGPRGLLGQAQSPRHTTHPGLRWASGAVAGLWVEVEVEVEGALCGRAVPGHHALACPQPRLPLP